MLCPIIKKINDKVINSLDDINSITKLDSETEIEISESKKNKYIFL